MGMVYFTYQNSSYDKLFMETVTMTKIKLLHIVPPYKSFNS